MLFKFTCQDVQNAAVVDCATGAVVFRIATMVPGTRSRSASAASFYSFASSSSSSRELCRAPVHKYTSITGVEGESLAEITWQETTATSVRIGDEVLAGTAEVFDAAFVKVLPDETLIPTRMEYTWRTTPESLTLLDDDTEVIGKLYQDSVSLECELFPAAKPGAGHHYLQLNNIPADEIVEVLVSFLLICTLRERMYWITTYVYGERAAQTLQVPRSPLGKLRKQASRSFANWREAVFRSKKH